MSALIDASAVLAAILGEAGADVAFAEMVDGAISLVNLSEVYTRLVENGVEIATAEQQVGRLDLEHLAFTHRHAACVATLRPSTRPFGLSFGDRACLAHAMIDRRRVITADRIWLKLDLGLDIRLIR